MSNLVSKSDFVDELSVASNHEGFSGSEDSLTRFITEYEPEFLALLFGSDFATLFINSLNDSEIPVDARWTALNTPQLRKAITCYVYYWWQRNDDSQTVGTGTVKSKNTNSVIYTARDKVSRNWTKMRKIAWATIGYLKANAEIYPEYIPPYWATVWVWDLWDIDGEEFRYFRSRYKMPDIFYPLSRL